MKDHSLTNEQKEIINSTLSEMPLSTVYTAQCASLCSLFISGAFISATIKQLVEELIKRHSGMIDMESAMEHAKDAMEFGVANDLFQKEDNKYTPTETGWFIGKDWERKLRLGWDA